MCIYNTKKKLCLGRLSDVGLEEALGVEMEVRSAHTIIPSWRLKTFGARRFEYAVPHLWNNILPLQLRQQTDHDKFKSGLKTCLFKVAYPNL